MTVQSMTSYSQGEIVPKDTQIEVTDTSALNFVGKWEVFQSIYCENFGA